jgi:signal recognition particle receptor subunit beta
MSRVNRKIIFTGPVGVGKTTAITTVSDGEALSTEERPSDETLQFKATTTVAMDYGVLELLDDSRVHLYGTPGQERFDFMWDILTQGGMGLVLLIDNARPDPVADLQFYLDRFKDFIQKTHLVIGVTRMDEKPRPGVEFYHRYLPEHARGAAIFDVDARNRQDVLILLQALLYVIDT